MYRFATVLQMYSLWISCRSYTVLVKCTSEDAGEGADKGAEEETRVMGAEEGAGDALTAA